MLARGTSLQVIGCPCPLGRPALQFFVFPQDEIKVKHHQSSAKEEAVNVAAWKKVFLCLCNSRNKASCRAGGRGGPGLGAMWAADMDICEGLKGHGAPGSGSGELSSPPKDSNGHGL